MSRRITFRISPRVIALGSLFLTAAVLLSVWRYTGRVEKECLEAEAALVSERAHVHKLRLSPQAAARVMPEAEVPSAIEEIAARGRALGCRFIVITPKEVRDSGEEGIRTLPIHFVLRSAYRSFGEFLVFLESYRRSITQIEGFRIEPNQEARSELDIEILISLAIE